MSPLLFPSTGVSWVSNGILVNSISLDGEDPKDPAVKIFGLMPVAPANPPGGLTAATPTPFAHTPASAPVSVTPMAPSPAIATGGINCGVCSENQAAQHAQANIAAGNIGNPHVLPLGTHGRNPDQNALLAHMNKEVARGIANLNSFLPSADKHCQAHLEAALTNANQHLSSAIATGRPTANILQQINRLENQLDAILNAI
jgi:hypothetical protein